MVRNKNARAKSNTRAVESRMESYVSSENSPPMQINQSSSAPFSDAAPKVMDDPFCIVCGTDFSDPAAKAADVAAALAKRLGEPLVLVHAVNRERQRNLPGELRDSLCLYARAQLHEEQERVRASQTE